MIKLNDICFAYDTTPIISHLNLSVSTGELLLIKGDNGCGKSTLLNIINALVFAERGTYIFDGEAIDKSSMKNAKFAKKIHQKIGYVFQNTDAQLFCSSVYDEIAFGVAQMGLAQSEVDARVSDVIAMLDIENLKDRAPYHLSMGEKKKVALASVLAVNPQVLILDEPMNFLDKKSRQWIKEFIAKMQKIGKTIVIVSHTDDFDDLADNVFNM